MGDINDKIDDSIREKYEVLEKLGSGAYGVVWRAKERRSGNVVALKKIFEAFRNPTDAQRTFREIVLLQQLVSHPNIIKLYEVMKAENDMDIYLTFECMETNLHAAIRANILEDAHRRFVIYQLLKALKFMHTGSVIHRDLKPSNLLLNSDCLVKVCDFGLARSIDSKEVKKGGVAIMTDYVATRWYRAPEVLLGSTDYSTAIDIWSVGCILGELMLGKPLFPGKSTVHQLQTIIEVIGRPSKEDMDALNNQHAKILLDSIPDIVARPITAIFTQADDPTLDILKRFLMFNPKKRITVEEALAHPYVADYREPESELVCEVNIKVPIDDNYKLTEKEYRDQIYDTIITKSSKSEKKEHRKSGKEKSKKSSKDGDKEKKSKSKDGEKKTKKEK